MTQRREMTGSQTHPSGQPGRHSPGGTSARGPATLSARDIVVSYGGVRAVDGMSLDVFASEAVGLIGPNGAGKSSFLAALGGQSRIQQGSVYLDGEEVSRLPAHARARRGVVRTFQMTSEFAGLTTFENLVTAGHGASGASLGSLVAHPRRTRERERAVARRAWEVLHRFGMENIADSYGRELSGGQRRLVEIMRCLMRSPKILLLDEPMVGVAPQVGARLLADLKSIRDDGIALIIVEHDLQVVRELCGRVVVMALGRQIAAGPYDDVVKDSEVQAAYLG